MKIEYLDAPSPQQRDELTAVWEAAVRSSHHFLTEADISYFRPRVRDLYLSAVNLYVIRQTDGHVCAFMGLSDDMVEMLFVLPEAKGHGFGTALLRLAIEGKNIRKVDVNEDNTEAYRFYLNRGYRITGRDATDSDGKPFPIIHLEI